jgi:hypothetical protein
VSSCTEVIASGTDHLYHDPIVPSHFNEVFSTIFQVAVDSNDEGVHLASLRSLVLLAETNLCKFHISQDPK